MSTDITHPKGLAVYGILTDFDNIRRKVLKNSPLANQKKLYGLTLQQSAAMNQVMLLMADYPQGVTLKMLSERVEMNSSAASVMVDKMVTKGFLERTINPNDRRTINIRLSAKGEKIISGARSLLIQELEKLTIDLTLEELNQLSAIAAKISKSAEV